MQPIGKPFGVILEHFAKSARLDNSTDSEYALLQSLVSAYGSKPVVARLKIRELLNRNPRRFCAAALRLFRVQSPCVPGTDFLEGLFLESGMALCALSEPELFPLDVASSLTRDLLRSDRRFDAKLLAKVTEDERKDPDDAGHRIKWVLAILDEVSDCDMLVHPLTRLLGHRDAHIRSKASLLLVRAHRNAEWLQTQLIQAEPRTMANLIEGLLDTTPTGKEVLALWNFTRHPNHRVSSTALLVLYRNGHKDAGERLLAMAAHEDERFRTAAAWAMGQSLDIAFLETLRKMARSDTGNARRMAFKASVHLRKTAKNALPSEPTPSETTEYVAETVSDGTL